MQGFSAYSGGIAEAFARDSKLAKTYAALGRRRRCRPSPYLNNVLEQDHRFIKQRIAASLWLRSVSGARNTIAGYEAMHMIRKGQIRWLAKGDVVRGMTSGLAAFDRFLRPAHLQQNQFDASTARNSR